MVAILSFFNDCSLQELTSVPTMSAKKAEKIIKMRPFDSWNDLVRMLLLTNSMFNIPLYIYCLYYISVSMWVYSVQMYCSCQRKSSEKQGSYLKCIGEF